MKFDTRGARFTTGLVELNQRLRAADAWAQAEPTRIAAAVQAVPAPWLGAARPSTPPRAAPLGAPDSPHLVLGPALSSSPAWDAYAAGRAAQCPPPPAAWAPRHPQQPPQQHQHPPGAAPPPSSIASPPPATASSNNGVRTGPGSTTFDVMAKRAFSRATDFANAIRPPFAAA